MSELYMRKVSFVCGATLEQPLTIHFKIPFDDSAKVNDAEISVYNLKDSTLAAILNKVPAILNAGYVDDSGVIFNGLLKNKATKWEGVDKITTFTCADSNADYLEKTFKKTYARNTNAETIMRDIITFAGLKVGEIDLPVNFVYRTGKTLNSKPKTLLTQLAKDCKAKLHINKGLVFIRQKDKGTLLMLPVSKETGLIDEPEEIEDQIKDVESTDKDKKKQRKGYKVKMLLNHKVTADTIISLTSRKVSGTFRVEKGEHVGKTDSQEWYTNVEVFPL